MLLSLNCAVLGYNSKIFSKGFGEDGDPESTLLQYWAYIEAKKLKNITKARELWKQIMGLGHNKSAQWWLAFIQFER